MMYIPNFIKACSGIQQLLWEDTHIHMDSRTILCFQYKGKKKLHGLSPRANYTGRVTAACRRSDGCHVVSMTDPNGRILGFVDRSRYFSIK
jgi:hypothetical protein